MPFNEAEAQAGHQIALSFGDQLPETTQLQAASELGVTILETSRTEILDIQEANRFYLFIQAGPRFIKNYQLQENPQKYVDRVTQIVREIPEDQMHRVLAVQIFEFPHEWYSAFGPLSEQTVAQIAEVSDNQFYYTSLLTDTRYQPTGIHFTSLRVPTGYDEELNSPVIYFEPSDNIRESLITLEHIMQQSRQFEESVIVIPAEWILNVAEHYPDVGIVISLYHDGVLNSFPLPAERTESPAFNWDIILLFIIWGSFVIHFRYQPIYSQSLMRYFTNHTFFVEDVMEHRIRNIMPGMYLLIQHTFLTGLFIYLCSELLLTESGREIISDSFSNLIFMQNVQLNFFILGILLALILQTISVLWIYLLNKNMKRISQTVNLYSWPLHLNLLVVTCLVMFNQIDVSQFWIILFCSLFVLVWFFSFNIAAVNATKFLEKFRILYLAGTVGIHVLILSLVIIHILFTPALFEPLAFAFTAP